MESKENWDFLVWMVLAGGVVLFLSYIVLGGIAYILDKKEAKTSHR